MRSRACRQRRRRRKARPPRPSPRRRSGREPSRWPRHRSDTASTRRQEGNPWSGRVPVRPPGARPPREARAQADARVSPRASSFRGEDSCGWDDQEESYQGVGAQWELPGAVARETGAILSLSRCGRGILTPPRRRAFWPGGGPSCTLLDRREAAVLAMRWGALRSTQRRKEESRYEGLARATSYFVRGAKALGH